MSTIEAVKCRPILFSAPMVRAILDGTKTQTRRIVKSTTECAGPINPAYIERWKDDKGWAQVCPFGKVGDRLWVRETWGLWDTLPSDGPNGARVFYRATDGERRDLRSQLWRPSIHMPRWASRITLEIVDVRVERLQDISEADALAEGVDLSGPVGNVRAALESGSARYHYANLWESINGAGAWANNPWVWVLGFKRIGE